MRRASFISLLFLSAFCIDAAGQSLDRALPSSRQELLLPDYRIPYPRPLHDNQDTLSIHIIGDVIMHAPMFTRDHREFFKNVATPMREADIAIANMEMTFAGEPYTGYPAFSAPEYIAPYMAGECGVDVFLTANNHITDKGRDGLVRTLELYDGLKDSLGLKVTGSARDEKELLDTYPLILERKGFKIAVINCTYGTNTGLQAEWPKVNKMKEAEMHAAFERAKERGADFIIAMPHWGEEYHLRHSAAQQKWAEWMVDEGADIIIGGHPHVVQDTTHIKGVPVIYSVGNAVSNQPFPNTRIELAVTVRFVHDRTTGERKMLEPELRFMWCTLHDMLIESYATIFVKEWANRRSDWLTPSDFDNMLETYRRVKDGTGIED